MFVQFDIAIEKRESFTAHSSASRIERQSGVAVTCPRLDRCEETLIIIAIAIAHSY